MVGAAPRTRGPRFRGGRGGRCDSERGRTVGAVDCDDGCGARCAHCGGSHDLDRHNDAAAHPKSIDAS
jgi:hypothetical protein